MAEESEGDRVDASAVSGELSHCLRPMLNGLPPEQRLAIEVIDLDGMPQASAARLEGVSLSGMKSRVQRGRRRLAELLGQCCAITLDAIADDQVAAERVELVLAETGVCSGGLIEEAESAATTGGSCCGRADGVADSIPAAGIAW